MKYCQEKFELLDRHHSEHDVFSESSLLRFCQFVNQFTRLAEDPRYTSAVCEYRMEEVRINWQDVSLETIDVLIDTLLNAITHLEEKWKQEQIRRQKLERKRLKNRLFRFFRSKRHRS